MPIPNLPPPRDSKRASLPVPEGEEQDSGLPNLEEISVREHVVDRPKRRKAKRPEAVLPEEESADTEEWALDPTTGVRYKKLGKTEWLGGGFSKSNLDPKYNALDGLNELAADFLGHLQVAPSKEEMEELRRLKFAQEKEQSEYVAKLQEQERIKDEEIQEKIKAYEEKQLKRMNK